MSDTKRHKIIGKWLNGLISMKDIPISIKKQWNRNNGDLGEFRNRRIKIRISDMKKIEENDR